MSYRYQLDLYVLKTTYWVQINKNGENQQNLSLDDLNRKKEFVVPKVHMYNLERKNSFDHYLANFVIPRLITPL